jgi:hypothetical protein
MKSASAAVIAILASGQYLRFDFYKMVLPTIGTVFFHTGDTGGPLIITTPASVGGVYLPGLTITRSAFTQKLGLEVQSCDLTISPQSDNPGGAVTLGGAPFMSQVVAGVFDGATITVSKGIFPLPVAGGPQLDVSGGIVPFFAGVVSELQAGRFSVDITINEISQLLNVQMPRDVVQAGCGYEVFDASCTLLAATFTSTGSVSGGVTANSVNTGLTQVDDYWQRGVLTWTSGAMNGSKYAVQSYKSASGKISSIIPWASAPGVADTFSIRPNCLKTKAACGNTNTALGPAFNNAAHYPGQDFVPQPENLYDGGTPGGSVPTLGGQGGQGAGSSFSGIRGPGTYAP